MGRRPKTVRDRPGQERAEEESEQRRRAEEAEPQRCQLERTRGETERDADDAKPESVAEDAAERGDGDTDVKRTQRGVVVGVSCAWPGGCRRSVATIH